MNKGFSIVLMLLTPIFLFAQSSYLNRDAVAVNVDVSPVNYFANNLRTTERITTTGHDKLKDEETTQTYLPVFSTGINFSSNPSMRRLNVKTELSAAKMKSTVQSRYQFSESAKPSQYSYRFSSYKISFIPRVMYSSDSRHQLKWYMGVGGSLSTLLISKNSVTGPELNKTAGIAIINKDYLRYNRFYLNPIVRTGIQMKQAIDLSLIFSNRANYTGLSSKHNVGSPTMTFTASYIFHK